MSEFQNKRKFPNAASPLHPVENRHEDTGHQHPFDLDSLFRRYSGLVASLIYGILGSPQDVEDIVQEVFIDAHKGLRRLKDPTAVKAWLSTIAIRKAKRYISRHRFLKIIGLDADDEYMEVPDNKLSPEQRSQIASLYRLLDSVSANKRIAWVLRQVEGESMNNITTSLKCSRATAHRWIAEVQNVVEEEFSDECEPQH